MRKKIKNETKEEISNLFTCHEAETDENLCREDAVFLKKKLHLKMLDLGLVSITGFSGSALVTRGIINLMGIF